MPESSIIPWEDVIICTEAPEETTEQGVYLTANDDKKKPEKGIVVAVGPSSEKGKKLPIALQPGDLIFYERYTSNEIPWQGRKYNFIRFKSLMGAVRKGDL
jgi:chaperonin GroES